MHIESAYDGWTTYGYPEQGMVDRLLRVHIQSQRAFGPRWNLSYNRSIPLITPSGMTVQDVLPACTRYQRSAHGQRSWLTTGPENLPDWTIPAGHTGMQLMEAAVDTAFIVVDDPASSYGSTKTHWTTPPAHARPLKGMGTCVMRMRRIHQK